MSFNRVRSYVPKWLVMVRRLYGLYFGFISGIAADNHVYVEVDYFEF